MTDFNLTEMRTIANRLHSRAACHTEAGHHTGWGKLLLDAEEAILSLIERVERAEAANASWVETVNNQNQIIQRAAVATAEAEQRGYLRGLEEAEKAAEGPIAHVDQNTGEARYRGDLNGHHWEPPRPQAGYRGSEYGHGRDDAAKAIRNLKVAT